MDPDVAETPKDSHQMNQWEAASKFSEGTLYLSFERGCLLGPSCSVRPPQGCTPVLTAHPAFSTPDGRFQLCPEGQLNEQHVYTFLCLC